MKSKKQTILKLISICLALVVWQVAAMVIHSNILLVTPIAVILRLLTIWTEQGFLSSLWFTFWHIICGFLLGVLTGILLAVLSYRLRTFEILLWPWMSTIKSVPVASFVVICLIWLSAGNLSIFISFLIVVPTIYQNVLSGLRAQNQKLLEMAQIYKMNPLKRIKYITISEISDYLITACSISAGMAWKAGVAAEIIGTPSGSIGKMLYNAKIYLDTDGLLAWTTIIVIVSVVSEKLFIYVLKTVLPGKHQERKPNADN